MPQWPSTLPHPLGEGYGLNPVDGVARTDMEAGAPRARRRFTGMPTLAPCNWLFTEQQFSVFEAWHHWTIADGAAPFEAYMMNGKGKQLVTCKFSGAWTSVQVPPNKWRVSASLLVLVRPLLTQNELQPYL